MNAREAKDGATFVVELTPPGRAAVAVVLVTGPAATTLVGQLFSPTRGGTLDQVPFERIVVGRWGVPHGEELVVARLASERIEIHCHGGLAPVNAVIDALVSRGCHRVSWSDWVRENTGDPVQAAAQIALADAPTARTAAILLDQYGGALSDVAGQAIAAANTGNWPWAIELVDTALTYRLVGIHLTEPWRVVLVGRTNVGKSSLINALAGFDRAIVSWLPGTTRDVVTTATAIDGWPVLLADTAGLRPTHDELESAGVRLTLAALKEADLLLRIEEAATALDPPSGESDDLSAVIGDLPQRPSVILVRNKVDLLTSAERTALKPVEAAESGEMIPGERQRDCTLFTSAKTGEGIADLVAAIGKILVPNPPPRGTAVPFTIPQVAALEAARLFCQRQDAAAVAAALQQLLAAQATRDES
jgi:tRNA modification GTPase